MSNSPETNRQRSRPIRLMLIEDDPVFRLGLVTALEQVPTIRVVFEADTSASALRVLQDWLAGRPMGAGEEGGESLAPDLVLLSLELGQYRTGQTTGLALCQQIKTLHPQLPLLLLSTRPDPLQLATALQAGVEGFCPKGTEIAELVTAIRQVATGRPYWNRAMQTITQALQSTTSVGAAVPGGRLTPTASSPLTDTPSPSAISEPAPSETATPLAVLRRNLRVSGIQQIESAIALLEAQLQHPNLTLLEELVLTGRRRELRAARWLVNRLLAPPQPATGTPSSLPSAVPVVPGPAQGVAPTQTELSQGPAFEPSGSMITAPPITAEPTEGTVPSSSLPLTTPSPAALRSLRAALFDITAARLQTSLRNLTEVPLEIDILKEEKKRELLYTILRQLEDTLEDLRASQVSPEQLEEKSMAILLDLWQDATTDFFGKYFTIPVNNQPIEIVNFLLLDADIVQAGILDKIPLVPEFLTHLLFQTPLTIDDDSYAVGTVEAMARMEILLQNLAIQIGNAVMQPLLNRFGNIETIKRSFYDKRLLSTREIERFRNNLSWRYRMERYFSEPKAIFESRYYLFALTEGGISRTSIYAPRNQELAELSGISLAVTLALEARDAIAPRFRSAISFLGSGVVYLLTEVVGRGIGLIGRGIVKGIGNALQDTKFSRNSERSR